MLPGAAGTSNERAANSGEIKQAGMEAELLFTIQQLFVYANYSLQKSWLQKVDVYKNTNVELDSNLYPMHMIKAGANYKIPKAYLNFNVEGRFITNRIASESNSFEKDSINYLDNIYEMDSYFLMDCMISSWDLKFFGDNETRISAKVNNVIGTKYVYPGFGGYDIPGFRRTFTFTLMQEF
jgi:hypothetical protein